VEDDDGGAADEPPSWTSGGAGAMTGGSRWVTVRWASTRRTTFLACVDAAASAVNAPVNAAAIAIATPVDIRTRRVAASRTAIAGDVCDDSLLTPALLRVQMRRR
jgi:hypothetical protein